jgi:hypothetical protein
MKKKIISEICFTVTIVMTAINGTGCEGCGGSVIVGDAGAEDYFPADPALEELEEPLVDEIVSEEESEEEMETPMIYWSRNSTRTLLQYGEGVPRMSLSSASMA